MWRVLSNSISMTEGDFGVALPITIGGTTLAASDTIKLTVLTGVNGDEILSKEFTNIQQNTVSLELTEAESALLPVGSYVYRLDWYNDGVFMCCIVEFASFKVVEKA